MTGPIDTIREALVASVPSDHPAHAALTEVEQQLAEQKESIRSITVDSGQVISRATARAVAAETALAEANQKTDKAWDFERKMMERATEAEEKLEAAEQRANDLQERLRANHDDVRKACERAERAYRERDALADALREIVLEWDVKAEDASWASVASDMYDVARAALDQDEAVT